MPTSRVTKQTTHLNEREIAICRRVKEARQKLRLDQAEVARRLGLKAHSISTIEKCRAPLRFDIALRFCRELLVNEEWLATGGFSSLEQEARKRRVVGKGVVSSLHPLFFRLTADLWSEDVTRTIPARSLFSVAFDEILCPVYSRIASESFYRPRLKPNPHDGIEIFRTFFDATLDASLLLLSNDAKREGRDELMAQRLYLRGLFEAVHSQYQTFNFNEVPLTKQGEKSRKLSATKVPPYSPSAN